MVATDVASRGIGMTIKTQFHFPPSSPSIDVVQSRNGASISVYSLLCAIHSSLNLANFVLQLR
jgi:hypothetical protein